MYHYARVLIEMDTTKGCEEFIMYESEGQIRFASLKYEQLPYFYSHCGIVRHSIENCRSINGRKGNEDLERGGTKNQKHREGVWTRLGGPAPVGIIGDKALALEGANDKKMEFNK